MFAKNCLLSLIYTCRKVPLQVNFFRWRHFALTTCVSSFSGICLIVMNYLRKALRVNSALFIKGVHIGTRALYVLNLIWFGYISRLSQRGGGGVISSFKWFLPAFATCIGRGRGIGTLWYRQRTKDEYCRLCRVQFSTQKSVSSPKYLFLKATFFNLQEAEIKIRSI